jgi:hypothetical protein
MSVIQINLERLGNARWIGGVYGPRGGREIKTDDLDAALDLVRDAVAKVGQPLPPAPPIVPVPFEVPVPQPQPQPHFTRRPRRGSGK